CHDEPWKRCGGLDGCEDLACCLENRKKRYASRRALVRRAGKSQGRRLRSHGRRFNQSPPKKSTAFAFAASGGVYKARTASGRRCAARGGLTPSGRFVAMDDRLGPRANRRTNASRPMAKP